MIRIKRNVTPNVDITARLMARSLWASLKNSNVKYISPTSNGIEIQPASGRGQESGPKKSYKPRSFVNNDENGSTSNSALKGLYIF